MAQGVPPSIALAVAQKESSFNPNARGSAGEIGLFQLMPKTADSLNVDPNDVTQNISGGVSFLAQLYQRYGNWTAALSAYNSGSPTRSTGYANSVLAIAGGDPGVSSSAALTIPDSSMLEGSTQSFADSLGIDPSVLIIGGVAGALVLLWWVAD